MDKLFVQSGKHLERFCNLGVDTKKIEVAGSVKYDIEPAKETSSQKKLPNKFILAASTHKGEEEIVLNAYKSITVCLKLFETTLFSPKSSFAQPSQIVYLLDRVKTA